MCRDKTFEDTDPFGGIGHYNNLKETCHHPRCCILIASNMLVWMGLGRRFIDKSWEASIVLWNACTSLCLTRMDLF
jgi:hypothetical protein